MDKHLIVTTNNRPALWLVFCVLMYALSMPTLAGNLPNIIRMALANNPAIDRARIEYDIARSERSEAVAQHYPTFGFRSSYRLKGSEALFNRQDRYSHRFVSKLNVYAGGSIQERVRGADLNLIQQRYRIQEEQARLTFEMAQLYLQGLAVYEQIQISNTNRERHQAIIDKMATIVEHDIGRRSDLTLAASRLALVDTDLSFLHSDLLRIEYQLETYTNRDLNLVWQAPTGLALETAQYQQAQNPALKAGSAAIGYSESQYRAARKSTWPRLDVEMLAGGGDPNQVNMLLEWTLFDRATHHANRRIAHEKEQAQATQYETRRNMDELIVLAERDLQQAKHNLTYVRQQEQQATQVIADYEAQFAIARRTLLDVLNAYSELVNIEMAESRIQASQRNALLSLRYAKGYLVDWAHATASHQTTTGETP